MTTPSLADHLRDPSLTLAAHDTAIASIERDLRALGALFGRRSP